MSQPDHAFATDEERAAQREASDRGSNGRVEHPSRQPSVVRERGPIPTETRKESHESR